MSELSTVEIFTDGACKGNPGPGGWGAVIRYGDREKEVSGGESHTTNNRTAKAVSAAERAGVLTVFDGAAGD